MNKFLNVVLRESPLDSPFVPKAKCGIDGMALLGDIFGFFGDAMGAISQQDANTTNLKIARMNRDMQRETNQMNLGLQRETNAQNYKIFQEQNAFTEDMWNKQNAYNDPSAQVQRMLAAGINPAAQFGKVAEASSVGSASANPMQAAHMVAPQMQANQRGINFGMHGFGNAFLQAQSMKQAMALQDSQIQINNSVAEYNWQSMRYRLQQELNHAKEGTIDYEQKKENLRLFNETFDAQKNAIENNAQRSEREVQKMDLDIAAQQIQNRILQIDESWREKMNEAQWQSLKIGIREAASRVSLNQTEAALNNAREAVETARKRGLDISNEQADQLLEIIVDEAEIQLADKEKEFYQGKFANKYAWGSDKHVDTNRQYHLYRRQKRHNRSSK